MSVLTFISRVTLPGSEDWSRISDLAVVRVSGQDRLYATSNYDGVISSWNINGVRPALLDQVDHLGGLRPGGTGWLATLDIGGAPTLLTGGASNGGLRFSTLAGTGEITPGGAISGTSGALGAVQGDVTVTLGNGQQVIYGGMAGTDGLGRIRFDPNGNTLGGAVTADTASIYAGSISDVAHLNIGGQDYLYSLSASEHGLQSWVVGSTGGVAAGPGLGINEGLWIATPTALDTARVAGVDYLVVGSATSNSMSVIRVAADGSLHVTDHMLDSRDTRFGGVTALDVITLNGQTFVASGGADDGINLHQLLPGGQLVQVAAFADTAATSLANISAITAFARGGELQVFATSASETGITKLTFDTGTTGQTLTAPTGGGILTGGSGRDILTGVGGADRLFGGAGDDILRDGAGSDTLTGGAGRDLFILSYDGQHDVITDFTPGEDRLDLSGWPMVRAKSQLTLEITATGFRVTYGDEVLDVIAADGNPIDHRTLTEADLIGGARIPDVILPGFPGPYTRPPTLPDRPSDGTISKEPLPGITIDGQFFRNPLLPRANTAPILGTDRSEVLRAGSGRDVILGRDGNDTLIGGWATDRLYGQFGRDRLYGGVGDDLLRGGRDHDLLFGGNHDDLLQGESGNDRLLGGNGDDMLYGGSGHDTLWGGAQNDRIYGGTGTNLAYGQSGHDRISGSTGRDRFSGGSGNDVIAGGAGHDRLTGGDGLDKLYGGAGNDVIWGNNSNDRIDGGSGNDAIWGGAGTDLITGGAGNDRISGGNWHDNLQGGAGHDTLRGDNHDDALLGGGGDDRIFGGHGQDRAWGGAGHDAMAGGDGDDAMWGGDDDDRLFGGAGADTLSGGQGGDMLRGDDGDDLLSGDDSDDTLLGGTGADTLLGQSGNDTLLGQDGDDRLQGGAGDDALTGGAGADTFVFDAGADQALDFEQGLDRIAINLDLFPGTLTGNEIVLLHGEWDGTTAILSFVEGHMLTITGVLDFDTLGQSIDVF